MAIIKNGKLVALNDETLSKGQTKIYNHTEDENDAAAFAGEGLQVYEISHNQVTVIVKNNLKELISVMNRYPVKNIITPNQSLEDIFMQYYGEDKS